MAISYPVTPPARPKPQAVTITASATTGLSVSPYTGHQQAYSYQAQAWRMDVTLPPMTREQAEPWIAFLLSLNGRKGTFYMGDPTGRTPRGSVPGTPLVNGASQTGQELATDGWTPSQTGILKAGDYIQIGYNLHRIMVDANSNGSGQATLDIWPRIRTSPADNAAITVRDTVGTWRLLSDDMTWEPSQVLYGMAFSAVEAF